MQHISKTSKFITVFTRAINGVDKKCMTIYALEENEPDD
jgi:hypothetical protein